MKINCLFPKLLVFSFLFYTQMLKAQTLPVQNIFPEGTVMHNNIPYANDTLKKHLLDIYLPPNANNNTPLIVWVHGGAWMLNDKYADMGYMKKKRKRKEFW